MAGIPILYRTNDFKNSTYKKCSPLIGCVDFCPRVYLLNFSYRCPYENCQFETKYPKSLHSHVKDQHTGGTTKRTHRSEDSKSIVHCVECGKTYKKWYYQQVHKPTCGNQSTLSCEICHQVCG